MPRIVSVVVPIPKDQAFDYILPDALEDEARVGSALSVPFGSRRLTGYLVAYAEGKSRLGEGELRQVQRVLSIPPLSPELLGLGRWIADYYFASLGETLHAMVPGPAARGPQRTLGLTAAGKDPSATQGLNERARALLECLAAQGPATAAALRRRLGWGAAVDAWIRRLVAAGFIETSFRARDDAAPLFETLAIAAPAETVSAWLAGPGRRAPARARLVTALAASPGPVPYEDLRRAAGATRTLVRYLVSEGIVSLESKPTPQQLDAFHIEETSTQIDWNDEKRAAMGRIGELLAEPRFAVVLVHGATGSGKTFLYIEAARKAIAAGRTALVLVPEIALTPQTVHRFKAAFGDRVAVIHSSLPDAERVGAWHEIARGDKDLVIGPRSAVFAPLARLGLVVVDEEHETAYKQEDAPRYHARDVAVYRAKLAGALVLLGSATPSLESIQNVIAGRYEKLTLGRGRPLPPVRRVDLRAAPPGPDRILSEELVTEIGRAKAEGAQTILLLNRRGYAVFLLCEGCGYVPRCPHCSVTMTYHLRGQHLLCHYCGRSDRSPARCPLCGGTSFRYRGTGTQRVEEEVRDRLPGVRFARMDQDATRRRGAHGEILRAFARGELDLLLGTQMIAKGLDFPRVRLVGVVSSDIALNLPDFRAAERTFSLLVQVAGRAGRGEGESRVVIQSWNPEHPAIRLAAAYAIDEFQRLELAERAALRFPPFSSLVGITLRGRSEAKVEAAAWELAPLLGESPRFAESFHELLGPTPAPIAKVRDHFRWQILLKARRERWRPARRLLREATSAVAARARGVEIMVDVDAGSLL